MTRTADILNELLWLERESLVERLADAANFVSWPVAGNMVGLGRIVAEEKEHNDWLAAEIYRLDSAPRPVSPGMDTAAAHYLDYSYVLPQIIEDKRRIVAAYRKAIGLIPSSTPTARLLEKIASRHEEHLRELQKPAASAVQPSSR